MRSNPTRNHTFIAKESIFTLLVFSLSHFLAGHRIQGQVRVKSPHLNNWSLPHKKTPSAETNGVLFKILAMSYSHMGRPHTTIGAERFHF